ncbi:peptidoglycan-binding domain-containing protein [Catellatospora sp. NPDC049609]|uniref:peptidoglycan-binding domain-containing protein n=1 Tax=Catellatospora sp. NPDC049609 TaxID=3155505 RepID=UPI0034154E4B
MSYAPRTLLDLRAYLKPKTGLSDNALGIVGDSQHGSGYHLGRDRLKHRLDRDYSTRTARDKAGLTDAASAFDLGNHKRLREFSVWLVAQCRANAADTRDIREVIYSPDGRTVLRWDRERGVSSAPKAGEASDSHRYHTHISWYRDSEHRDKTAVFKRFYVSATPPPAPAPKPPAAPKWPGRLLRYRKGKPQMHGADVLTWQKRMKARGWRIDADGWYGPQSAAVCLAFQTEKRLTRDGIVGPQTWAAAWTAPVTNT